MVSPAPLATANSPLSYAERAKKAQNTRSSQIAQQRSISQSTSSNAVSSAASTAPSPATVRPTSHTSPTALQATPPSHLTGDVRSAAASHPLPAPSSQSAVPPTADPLIETKVNGDVKPNGDSASVPSASSVQNQASAPPVNVWVIRKEQMATRGQSRSTNSSSSLSQTSAGALVPSQSSGPILPKPIGSNTSPSLTPTLRPSVSAPAMNTNLISPNDYDDPFVVRPGRSPPSITPPTIDDAESWPEVGQAAATPPHVNNGRTEGKGKEGDEDRRHERESSQGHSTRKSEKTKWVPVPPEELQFERPNRTQQQRHRLSHADRNPRKSDAASAAPSTSSGQGSQQQSRAHSSTGVRPPPSHAGSVSHSQAQSRTGSVHSSPRHPSVRGGGRRLPDDTGALGFAANRSVRSSGPNSPATYAQPQPLPPSEFIPGSRPFVNTNVSGRDVSSLGAISDSNAADMPPPGAYYPPPGPPFGVSPYHSPRPAGSPALNPYALPSVPYPGQPGIPTPIPIPGYGTPPYPMYPPYPYAYGQPYMYWPPPHAPAPQGISIASPTNLIQPGDPGLPPPTLVARPPPPSESEAVAGYRDVGFALPPPAEQSHNGQVEGDSVERGRARELSFGTVALEGATSPSGSPSSSAVLAPEAREVAANDKKAYEAARVDPTAGDNKVNGENANGKTFAVFSIGVAPGEPGPARLRSRTRTHSKGAVTSVSVANSSIRETLSATGGPDAEDISALGEAVANVIDLTDSKATLAFGTTQQADDITSEGTSAEPPASSTVPDVMPSQLQATTVPMMSPYAQPFAPLIVIPSGPINGMASAPSPSSYSRQPPTSATEDDLAVRDYGYGFGRGGPQQGFPPQRDDRPFRDRRDFQPQGDNYGRPRRGSYGQGFDRGSFGGRRGRGLSGGYGGRGYSNRSFAGGRGGYGNQGQPRQQAYVPQPPPPPPPPQPDLNGYYAPPMATYIPSPYDSYPYAVFPPPPPPPQMVASTAPLPVPLSQLLFPLDSTRYYLLGQLEYYLSVQNMEQDFFLRQQMDSLGWIPIGLIASFNRVRSLTTDSQLVTDVLTLSSLVEVRDGYVRMHQWQQYVLPTARKSSLEDDSVYPASGALAFAAPQGAEPHQGAEEENATAMQTHEGEEDEDEDVEFVM